MTLPSSRESDAECQPIMRLAGVTKVFFAGEVETHALADVSLTVRDGEFLTIAGPSGCGKSTLLSIMGLLEPATLGEYWLRDVEVARLTGRQRSLVRSREIGFIFQSFHLIGDLTVFENVELPLIYQRVPRRQRKALLSDAIERVGMTHRRKHVPAQLSGGQQQRVAVARALVTGPSILLADEPTGNLDSVTGGGIMDLLADLNAAGVTLCLVTHDLGHGALAHRTVRLLDGQLQDAHQSAVAQ